MSINRNFHAVVWTKISGTPQKMGDLVLDDQKIVFTYTDEYRQCELPGISLLGDQRLWRESSVAYATSERIPFHPRLISLLPGRNPRNIQRRQFLNMLRKEIGREPPRDISTEWRLLTLGGHGGVGHVDVFGDDLSADKWYRSASPSTHGIPADRSQIWRMVKREVLDQDIELDPGEIDLVLGPTPTVGGMISKMLVGIDRERLEQDDQLILFRPQASGAWDVVMKIEPPEYKGLLDLEALCLTIHKEAGFEEVPDFRRYNSGDLRLLAVERFDRRDGRPLPMESLFSVIASGDNDFRETGDILLEELGDIFDRLGEVVNLSPDTKRETYKRIIMALLTGNGDLHLENLSLIGGVDQCGLSPVYDPAPMRAWPRHNILSAIPFDPEGYSTHSEYFVSLGQSFGLSMSQVREILSHLLQATDGYAERVMELKEVPEAQRMQLVEASNKEREGLKRELGRCCAWVPDAEPGELTL